MSSFLLRLFVVNSPSPTSLAFFAGGNDFCTFHVQKNRRGRLRMLFLKVERFQEIDDEQIEVIGKALLHSGWSPLRLVIDKATGQGRITWCLDANGSVDLWPHLTPFPTESL